MILRSARLHVTINSRVITGFYFSWEDNHKFEQWWNALTCFLLSTRRRVGDSTLSLNMEYTQRHYGEFLESSLKGTGTHFEGGATKTKECSYSTAQQQHQCVGFLFSIFMTTIEPLIYRTLKWRIFNTIWSRVKQRTDQGIDTTSSPHMVPDFHLRSYYSILWLQ